MIRNVLFGLTAALFGVVLVLGSMSVSTVAADCASTNTASIEDDGTVSVNCPPSADFAFALVGEWALKSNPAWITIQIESSGSENVLNVEYAPAFLQNQDCIGSYSNFTCQGDLEIPEENGYVHTQFDAGISPDHARDFETTLVPAPTGC